MIKYRIPLLYDFVMPNYILPNAIITELGIINYLHSLNSTRLNTDSFFEQSLNSGSDDHNPLTFLFDRNLGTFPNSVGGQSTHLLSGLYNHVLDRPEEALYFGKRHFKKYVYPIKVTPHFDDFSGVVNNGTKLNGEYFWKHMSAQALEDARNKTAFVFLDYAQENYIEKESYIKLHESLKNSCIPKSQIILAFNSFNAEELYQQWFTEEEQRLVVKNWPFVLSNTSYYYSLNFQATIEPLKFLSLRNKLRKNHFIFKVRRPRNYRKTLLYRLHNDNLLDKGDWSCLQKIPYNDYTIDKMESLYNIKIDKDKIRELHNSFPHSLQDEKNGTYDNISSWTDRHTNTYENAYFYICTETYTHGLYKSVTEKVCKPLVNFMPFVFVSFAGALKHLHSLGFKTFHPFIDESYDDEPDENKRLNMIYKEITKIASMSKEEIHEWYWKMQDILMHNHHNLLNYYKNETHSLEIIKYLHEQVNN